MHKIHTDIYTYIQKTTTNTYTYIRICTHMHWNMRMYEVCINPKNTHIQAIYIHIHTHIKYLTFNTYNIQKNLYVSVSACILLVSACIYFIHLYLHVSTFLYLHVCIGICLGVRWRDTTETVRETVRAGRVCAAHNPIQIKWFNFFQIKRIAIRSTRRSLPLHRDLLVRGFSHLAGNVLASSRPDEGPGGMQNRVHLFIAPHRSERDLPTLTLNGSGNTSSSVLRRAVSCQPPTSFQAQSAHHHESSPATLQRRMPDKSHKTYSMIKPNTS
jgi:hypothetical protein